MRRKWTNFGLNFDNNKTMTITPTWNLMKRMASEVFMHTDEKTGATFFTGSGRDYRIHSDKLTWSLVEPQTFYWEFEVEWASNNSYWQEISKLRLHDNAIPWVYYVMSMDWVMQLFFMDGWAKIDDDWIIRMEFFFQKRGWTMFVVPYSKKIKAQIAEIESRESRTNSSYKPWDIVKDWASEYAYLWKWDAEVISEWEHRPWYKSNNNFCWRNVHLFLSVDCWTRGWWLRTSWPYPYQPHFRWYSSKPRREVVWKRLTKKRFSEIMTFLNSTHKYNVSYDWRPVEETIFPIKTTINIPWLLEKL